mmetsp:Transcript_4046/g.4464  ORF Transcript_4046/g.4464 Transcript_4046/m.4464 type:complete len:444 (+) Transcript_4046:289-1620(+)
MFLGDPGDLVIPFLTLGLVLLAPTRRTARFGLFLTTALFFKPALFGRITRVPFDERNTRFGDVTFAGAFRLPADTRVTLFTGRLTTFLGLELVVPPEVLIARFGLFVGVFFGLLLTLLVVPVVAFLGLLILRFTAAEVAPLATRFGLTTFFGDRLIVLLIGFRLTGLRDTFGLTPDGDPTIRLGLRLTRVGDPETRFGERTFAVRPTDGRTGDLFGLPEGLLTPLFTTRPLGAGVLRFVIAFFGPFGGPLLIDALFSLLFGSTFLATLGGPFFIFLGPAAITCLGSSFGFSGSSSETGSSSLGFSGSSDTACSGSIGFSGSSTATGSSSLGSSGSSVGFSCFSAITGTGSSSTTGVSSLGFSGSLSATGSSSLGFSGSSDTACSGSTGFSGSSSSGVFCMGLCSSLSGMFSVASSSFAGSVCPSPTFSFVGSSVDIFSGDCVS